MLKIFLLLLLLGAFVSCKRGGQDNALLDSKNKTIDSLKLELEDCSAQAHIMADILEEERIELEKNKATK